ncbi:MAG: M48 family metallopeptidase [Propylenella sp.]
MRAGPNRGHERLFVDIEGRRIPVAVRRNARARRLILRVDHASGEPVLTLPRRTGLSEGARFLADHVAWLKGQVGAIAPTTPLHDGSVFHLRGEPCRIRHRGGRGLVVLEANGSIPGLVVPGDPDFLPRRVRDWLRREARRDLEIAVARYARALGRAPSGIRIADPKSRWGSCSPKGVLTFSWRLVLAPPSVLDYLAAHEVAHLKEMNHGPRFWAIVERLYPRYAEARDWLNREGPALSAVGRR